MKTTFLILLPLFILGCGSDRYCCDCARETETPTPRVRLVQDSERSFHFQWREPLPAERVILVRVQEEYVTRLGFKNPALDEVRTFFIIFPEGRFKSRQVHVRHGSQISIEILPAKDRYAVPLPAAPVPHTFDRLPFNGVLVNDTILAEHPFKPYEHDKPFKLTFTSEFIERRKPTPGVGR